MPNGAGTIGTGPRALGVGGGGNSIAPIHSLLQELKASITNADTAAAELGGRLTAILTVEPPSPAPDRDARVEVPVGNRLDETIADLIVRVNLVESATRSMIGRLQI